MAGKEDRAGFRIFRAAQAPSLEDSGAMYYEEIGQGVATQVERLRDAGIDDGHRVKMLFSMPGFSLSHSWFKCGFPLPLHSHNSDCLYYIVAGSLRLGTEDLGPGDGFFVPSDVPYGYTPGPDGVEILEFRHDESYSFRFFAKEGAPFWERALQQLRDNHPAWGDARMPSEAAHS
ncbi:MAG: cupin domain-containing protein [Sphingobium sp.]